MTELNVLTDPRFSRPGSGGGLIGVMKQRYLLRLLLKRGVNTRYYGSALGWIWSYVRPTAQFFMYYFVIGLIFGRTKGMENFAVYLFSGIITVNLFSEILRSTTGAITGNKALVQKIFLPREIFPLAATGNAIVHFLPQLAVLFVVSLVFGWRFDWAMTFVFLLGLAILIIFTVGLGLFFGALNVIYRDSKNVVDIILMFSTWASPVLYTFEMVKNIAPEWLYHFYMVNPVTTAVELMHTSFWAVTTPESARPELLWLNTLIGLGIALFTLVIGQLVFRKLEGDFAQNL